MNKQPTNIEDLRKLFQYLPHGCQKKIAEETNRSIQYVCQCFRYKFRYYNYDVFKAAIKYLPKELQSLVVFKFDI